MAKSVSYGYTDTAINGVTPPVNFVRGLPNFGEDWAQIPNGKGEFLMKNLTSPRDQEERIRIAYSEIANIYAGSNISSAYQAASTKGSSVLVQLNETWSETDDTDLTYRKDVPFQAHVVLKFANADFVTAEAVEDAFARLVSALYESGAVTTARLNALMRGSLKPGDM